MNRQDSGIQPNKRSNSVDAAAALESAEGLLARFDADGDNKIDTKEFFAVCKELFGTSELSNVPERDLNDIFHEFDENQDGVLDVHEWNRCFNVWIRPILQPVNVLVIVDVQNDFIDGTLAVRGSSPDKNGLDAVKGINRLIKEGRWHKIIFTQDWHPENHLSFYENLHMREIHPKSKISKEDAKPLDTVLFKLPPSCKVDKKNIKDEYIEQKLWPRHAVMNTRGSELHKDLLILPDSVQIRKGQNPDMDSYSAFDRSCGGRSDMEDVLSKINATDLFICGLIYEICVNETCMDALDLGYKVALIEDCCPTINDCDKARTKKRVIEKGGLTTTSDRVLDIVNNGKRSIVMARHAAKMARNRPLTNTID